MPLLNFFPNDNASVKHSEKLFQEVIEENGAKVIFWRTVPVNKKAISKSLNLTAPLIKQAFVISKNRINQDEFERKIFIIRRFYQINSGKIKIYYQKNKMFIYVHFRPEH